MKPKNWFPLLLLSLLSLPCRIESQNTGGVDREQTTFGGDEVPGVQFIKRPVSIPDSVLDILKRDDSVKACLAENAKIQVASWFVASEIRLGGNLEHDLVVLPSPRADQPDYGCFHSAEGFTSFWVFRGTEGHYELLLKTAGLAIEIKKSRHQGYRDIETGSPSAIKFIYTVSFRFDGKQYKEYGHKMRPL
jgi:hypothetical protein